MHSGRQETIERRPFAEDSSATERVGCMSANDTFTMHVPVDEILVSKGPGLTLLQRAEDTCHPEDGVDARLTMATGASGRLFVQRVRVWGFREQSGFSVLLGGFEHWCEYNHKTRTGKIDIEHPDDKFRREMRESADAEAAAISQYMRGRW